jgi:hypothetical protein
MLQEKFACQQEKFKFLFSLLSAREGLLEYPENIIWKLFNFWTFIETIGDMPKRQ